MILRNLSLEQFIKETAGGRIICFGAGKSIHEICGKFPGNHLEERISAFLDNDYVKQGTDMILGKRRIPVLSVDDFCKQQTDVGDMVLLITSSFHEVIFKQMDAIEKFKDLQCYIWGAPFMCLSNRKVHGNLKELLPSYEMGRYNIPRTIHYCWFGKGQMTDKEKLCIESWKKYCPEYELILWNEDNYDVRKNRYISEAYDAGKWGFVSDYARLDIVYNYGGFYFDLDVELIQSIEWLRDFKAFFGYEYYGWINTGGGFGSVQNNWLVDRMRGIYDELSFVNDDGSYNMKSCPVYHTELIKELGMDTDGDIQIWNDMLFLPDEYFCPVNQCSALYELNENTFGIHKFSCSWFDHKELGKWEEQKRMVSHYNDRLYSDYIRYKKVSEKQIIMSGSWEMTPAIPNHQQ